MISRRLLRIKCFKALYSHFQTEENPIAIAEKNMLYSITKSYDLYHLMLRLIVDVADVEENTIEQRAKKLRPTFEDLNPNRRFVENPIIAHIRNSENLNTYLIKNNLGWETHPELVKKLTTNLLDRAYYKAYMEKEEATYEDHKAFVVNFYKREIEDFDYIFEVLDEMSMFWVDEAEFITYNVMNSIKNIKEDKLLNDFSIPPIYKNKSDLKFVKELINETLMSYRDNETYINKYTRNWDYDRIALIDRILMQLAITEFIRFKDIPVSVTMNEYIELSKFYSTPQSNVFINGILDKIASELEDEGKLEGKSKK
ncbi:MAG: transcription antitermination protein NusB [Rikenellaceae bacterium]